MLKYRQGLADRPSYDMDTNEYRITLNANESTMNLPPIVEDRLMGRFASVAFNRYPGAEDYLSLTRQIAANFKVQPENILLGNGSSEIIEKLFYCFGGSKDAAIVYPALVLHVRYLRRGGGSEGCAGRPRAGLYARPREVRLGCHQKQSAPLRHLQSEQSDGHGLFRF